MAPTDPRLKKLYDAAKKMAAARHKRNYLAKAAAAFRKVKKKEKG